MGDLRAYIIFFTFSLTALACAQYGSPSGGPEDIRPPAIVEEESDPNFRTNFDDDEIRITFDEWVELNNPVREIVISPPLNYLPVYGVKGKTVVVTFNEQETLKERTTYQVNFGDAIRDYTAGNTVKNLVYVFSTGPVIDSLTVKGEVVDELSGKPVEDVVVMLYTSLSDSVILKEKPYYFTKTDKEGQFEIRNIRNDSFQIYALLDNNVSYTYDLPGEKIAFYDQIIHPEDSSSQDLKLLLFDEEDPVRLVSHSQDYRGLIKVLYDNIPVEYEVGSSEGSVSYFDENRSDTIFIWYRNIQDSTPQFFIRHGNNADTITPKKPRNNLSDLPLTLFSERSGRIFFHKSDSLAIAWNKPLEAVDSSRVIMRDTSGTGLDLNVSVEERNLVIRSDFDFDKQYTITLLPESVKGWYGRSNTDTLTIEAATYEQGRFGKITVNFSQYDSLDYLVSLMQNDKVLYKQPLDRDRIEFRRLSPGSYRVRVIEDRNGDGRWTPGELMTRKRSERIREVPLEELRKDWDLEAEINIKELFDGTES